MEAMDIPPEMYHMFESHLTPFGAPSAFKPNSRSTFIKKPLKIPHLKKPSVRPLPNNDWIKPFGSDIK